MATFGAKRKGLLDAGACRNAQNAETLARVNGPRRALGERGGGVMENARPLPETIVARYRSWMERRSPEAVARYAETAARQQEPKAMIIACCDSRVLISEIFGNEPGDFFIHRNIANLVPPNEPDGRSHGTSAAVEYAVIALGIEHLVVMGHHGCGGVRGCHDMLAGLAPELDTPTSFVGTWLRLLKPGYEALSGRGLAYEARITALEKEAVLVSLTNLLTFPFVRSSVEAGRLQLHGAWKDIRDGGLEVYDSASGEFRPL
jgi:carbonic anhydrase